MSSSDYSDSIFKHMSITYCIFCSKKMQHSLTSTNGVLSIDAPDINKPFGEFLLQLQGRLLSRSKKEGMSAPQAGVLLSSNSPEISWYVLYPV